MIKKITFVLFLYTSTAIAQQTSVKNIDFRVDSVLKLMTLEEKVGQLNQLSKDFATGTITDERNGIEQQVKAGSIGSFLNLKNIDVKIEMQKLAMESKLRIPLIYGYDVIHGHKTIFPIPLAQSCSWDIPAIEWAERIAAIEASADGINWTFSPMVDITHDPRWGRIMESSGEDPYLGSLIAAARVKGFQGNDLSSNNTIVACAKHFAAYGFAEGGRDYNTVDMSELRLRTLIFPPFKACVDAGVGTFMNSFNTLNGIPASMNEYLLRKILKGEWEFKGFVVSDWNSFGEVIIHGAASSKKEAAQKVITAGSDMDMEGEIYKGFLAGLVKHGKVDVELLDDAVRRVLRIKFMLGLFDDPYRYLNKEYRDKTLYRPEYLSYTRELARKTMVLLKNDDKLLPLSKNKYKKIAVVGPLADSKNEKDYLSFWAFGADQSKVITLAEGIKNKLGKDVFVTSNNAGDSVNQIAACIEQVKDADIIIAAIGEHGINNGEARSLSDISLPKSQLLLLQELKKTGKQIIVVLFTGRVITDKWLFENMPTVLNAWQPGQEAGNAIADVLFGDYNPSARLTITWPRSVGQIPLYYNYLNTGRPKIDETKPWVSGYKDETNKPQFCFGYGLSYSNFIYSNVNLSDTIMKLNQTITLTVNVKNESGVDGEEVVQLYIKDWAADVSRPVKELKHFQKVLIKAGETKEIKFVITEEDLKYWNQFNQYKADEGKFSVMVGDNCEHVTDLQFWYLR